MLNRISCNDLKDLNSLKSIHDVQVTIVCEALSLFIPSVFSIDYREALGEYLYQILV